MTVKAKNAEAENKMLVDRWMLQKMQDAERLNEVFIFLFFFFLLLFLFLSHWVENIEFSYCSNK